MTTHHLARDDGAPVAWVARGGEAVAAPPGWAIAVTPPTDRSCDGCSCFTEHDLVITPPGGAPVRVAPGEAKTFAGGVRAYVGPVERTLPETSECHDWFRTTTQIALTWPHPDAARPAP